MCYTLRMAQVKSRRALYVQSTRLALLDVGRRMFVERGYATVTAEEVVREAGLTRGALYHHFDGKPGLFRAVFDQLEVAAAHRIAAAMTPHTDLWQQALAGIDAFLDVCAEPEYGEIVLRQGPAALGWQVWRDLDQQYLGDLVDQAVQQLIDERVLAPSLAARPTARALYGALTELSLSLVEATDPNQARKDASRIARRLLTGLRDGRSAIDAG